MRVAFLSQSTFPSTTADSIQTMRMCAASADLGHDVRLLALDRTENLLAGADPLGHYGVAPGRLALEKIPFVEPRGSRVRYLVGTWLAFRRIRQRLKNDAVHAVTGRYLPGCLAASSLGIPTVYEAHGPVWNSRLEAVFLNKMLALPGLRGVAVISQALKDRFLERWDMDEEFVMVAPDAADPPPDDRLPEAWPGRPDALQAGYTGSFFPGRGVGLLVDLARALPDVDFHLMGGADRDLAKRLDGPKPDNVFCHGLIPPALIHRHRNACQVLLAPYQRRVTVHGQTDTTGYMSPMKVFEYMASGRPMLVSDLPVLREVLDEEVALLLPPDDAPAWVRALSAMRDPAARAGLAGAALARFHERHTWRSRAERLLERAAAL